MFPEGIMEQRVKAAAEAGLQTAIHAIGDRANAEILDIYERTAKSGPPVPRPRIEHAQHLRPADFARFARLGVIASVQPYHLIDDGRWAEAKIGPVRAESTYAFRSFLSAGAKLAFGSDWPVAPMDPVMGIYAAVTRATLDGKRPGGWIPAQKITVEEAVRAFTAVPAFAEFAESDKGTLEAGKWADLVLLDADIFRLPPERIKEARVLRTICGGKTIYRRSGS
jgi:predicted amidohydrolase YtcJ